MTDRKLTCVACKSAITEGDIAHSDLEFGGEIKATNQPEYIADADTDLVATIGTLDGYTPMVRTTGNQDNIEGRKGFSDLRAKMFGYKNAVFGSDNSGYIRVYKGKNATSTGVQMMVGFMNGKGYNTNDRNNWAIVIFCARVNVTDGEIVTVAKGSYQTAGAYALTYDADNYPEIWVKNTLPGITNHRMVSQVIMESDTNGLTDYFDVSDFTVMDAETFATTYPNAIYSS